MRGVRNEAEEDGRGGTSTEHDLSLAKADKMHRAENGLPGRVTSDASCHPRLYA